MTLHPVLPDDADAVAVAAELGLRAHKVDDPTGPEVLPELFARWRRYGWDLRPDELFLYTPDGATEPVATLSVDLPVRDNTHAISAGICVDPDHRRRGHGTVLMAEVLRRAREGGRTTLWMGGPADEPGIGAFLEPFGFRWVSHDARRFQWLAEVDRETLAALRAEADAASGDYRLERLTPPDDDALNAEIAVVAASINDAPMGAMTWEPEVFDAQLMRDVEAARVGRGDRFYRVVARHRQSGVMAGHTVFCTDPGRPERASQCDTAVAREHRGHRLGLLLKLEMLAWMAEVEPQLELVETWNQADNTPMIRVNEALGYRLDRVFDEFELALG